MVASVARLRGYKLVLHHHIYSYIDRHDWRVALLNRIVGASGAHVVHCDQMKDDFLAQYKTRAKFLVVPPTIVSQRQSALPRSQRSLFTLGLMSNLTIDKGLDLVLETFARLVESGLDVALVLAGPCMGKVEQQLVDEAIAKWPSRVEHRGPVYGGDKLRFFADIDVFLFPTRYKNESWGIVLSESLAAGCPVIASRRGCIPAIVQDGAGLIVAPEDDFVEAAAQKIIQWLGDRPAHDEACRMASNRAKVMQQEAHAQFSIFLEQMQTL